MVQAANIKGGIHYHDHRPIEPAANPGWLPRAGKFLAAHRWIGICAVVTVSGLVIAVSLRPSSTGGAPGPSVATSSSGVPAVMPGATANPADVPFGVTLVYDRNHVDNGAAIPHCGGHGQWVFPQPITSIVPPPGVGTMDETWAHTIGGVDHQVTNFKLAIQGKEPSAVNLLDIRLVDVHKTPGIAGPVVRTVAECGEPDEGRLKIILDPPLAQPITEVDGHNFPFTTSDKDLVQLQINAVASLANRPEDICNCLVSWRLAIDWAYKGQLGAPLIVDDYGKPFQTQHGSSTGTWLRDGGTWFRFS